MSHDQMHADTYTHMTKMETTIAQPSPSLEVVLATARAQLAAYERAKNMGKDEKNARSHLRFAESIMEDAEVKLARAQRDLERAKVQLAEARKVVEEFDKAYEENDQHTELENIDYV
ncbi:hypothetical protein HYFRA_00013067 [Hymenoscyphus fraxineus]|uniref:Uncharacterized protein n=1 Tax=Hymenoscyphus fraxineus TaxID=746836 RepID=A0A9N9L868_9HELO|nr:hypothetical protein HYFRA_00013067 [Hymenoscyphus fraxineus]